MKTDKPVESWDMIRKARGGLESMNKPLLIGITGGTGSGKSTVSKEILKSIHENVITIEQDSYYKDQSHLSLRRELRLIMIILCI